MMGRKSRAAEIIMSYERATVTSEDARSFAKFWLPLGTLELAENSSSPPSAIQNNERWNGIS